MAIYSMRLNSLITSSPSVSLPNHHFVSISSQPFFSRARRRKNFHISAAQMATSEPQSNTKVIDSHLHVWASPEEAANKYPYFPGQEPSLKGNVNFLLECMEQAGVDGALIVQPINHKFDHSYVTSVLNKFPTKFVGCCLANPAEDGSGVKELKHLVVQEGYCAVRFNPYLWPAGQQMTNEVGKAMFSKAGQLGIPVGFMCMKVYVKFSALFRVSRVSFPYEDLSSLLSQVVSSFGANRVMWGSDFPFVVSECGYKEAKEAVSIIANQIPLSSSDMEWVLRQNHDTALQE